MLDVPPNEYEVFYKRLDVCPTKLSPPTKLSLFLPQRQGITEKSGCFPKRKRKEKEEITNMSCYYTMRRKSTREKDVKMKNILDSPEGNLLLWLDTFDNHGFMIMIRGGERHWPTFTGMTSLRVGHLEEEWIYDRYQRATSAYYIYWMRLLRVGHSEKVWIYGHDQRATFACYVSRDDVAPSRIP
jgi:hypothetical protein